MRRVTLLLLATVAALSVGSGLAKNIDGGGDEVHGNADTAITDI